MRLFSSSADDCATADDSGAGDNGCPHPAITASAAATPRAPALRRQSLVVTSSPSRPWPPWLRIRERIVASPHGRSMPAMTTALPPDGPASPSTGRAGDIRLEPVERSLSARRLVRTVELNLKRRPGVSTVRTHTGKEVSGNDG